MKHAPTTITSWQADTWAKGVGVKWVEVRLMWAGLFLTHTCISQFIHKFRILQLLKKCKLCCQSHQRVCLFINCMQILPWLQLDLLATLLNQSVYYSQGEFLAVLWYPNQKKRNRVLQCFNSIDLITHCYTLYLPWMFLFVASPRKWPLNNCLLESDSQCSHISTNTTIQITPTIKSSTSSYVVNLLFKAVKQFVVSHITDQQLSF